MAAESSDGSTYSPSGFMWGEKLMKIGTNSTSYRSMRYKGVWYSVNDCAFLRSDPADKDHIGKLMSLFEDNGQRKIRVRWFFRAQQLPSIFWVENPPKTEPKEIFIALGNLKGVENKIPVDVILRKAIVLCTAKHPENPLPSRYNPDSVHHIFYRGYDTQTKKISGFHKIKTATKPVVKSFFNKQELIQALLEEPTSEEVEESTSEMVWEETQPRSESLLITPPHLCQDPGSGGIPIPMAITPPSGSESTSPILMVITPPSTSGLRRSRDIEGSFDASTLSPKRFRP